MTAPTAEESRALLGPLTGYTPGPWHHTNGSEVHDRATFFRANGERFGETPMLISEAYDPRAFENARLIAASPDLAAHLAAALDREAALRAERDAARAEAAALMARAHEAAAALQVIRETIRAALTADGRVPQQATP